MSGRKRGGGGDYEVGYGKPPPDPRFAPGQSGNPKGRPKGARGKHKLQDAILQRGREIFLEEGERQLTIREGDKLVRMDAFRLAVRACHVAAAKGGQMAQRTVIQTRLTLETEVAQTMRAAFSTAVLYKEECEVKRRECRRAGLPEPNFRPDPDDIIVDWETLTVSFQGPLTSGQQAQFDERMRLRDEWEEDFKFAREIYEQVGRTEAGLLNALISQCSFDVFNESLPERHRKELKNRLPNPDFERLMRSNGRKAR